MAKPFKSHDKPTPEAEYNAAQNGILNTKEIEERNKKQNKRMTDLLDQTLTLWEKSNLKVVEGLDLCVMCQRFMNIQAVKFLNKDPKDIANDKK